jgi:hypothetical protein
MSDRFPPAEDDVSAPARRTFPIVPSNTVPLPFVTKALTTALGGTVRLVAVDNSGQDATDHYIPPGAILPIRARMVLATGTNATDLVGLA